jgi:adenylate cyclase
VLLAVCRGGAGGLVLYRNDFMVWAVRGRLFAGKWWRSYWFYAPIVVLGVCLGVAQTAPAKRLEFSLLDYLIRLRHSPAQHADSHLFFVGIDDNTQAKFGRWPFARVFHGELLGFLSDIHPAAVTWDILFSEEDGINDDAFIQGIRMLGAPMTLAASTTAAQSENSIRGMNFGLTQPFTRVEGGRTLPDHESALIPTEALRKVCFFGFADSVPALDGVRRKVPLVLKIGDHFYPSLPLQSLMQFWKLQPQQLRIVLGDAIYIESPQVRRKIPINREGEFWINYRYEENGFSNGSYVNLHDEFGRKYRNEPVGNVPDLKGKLVVVTLTSTGSSEIGPSPLNERSLVPLVFMNVLDNILRQDYLRIANAWLIWIGWLLAGYGTVRIFEHLDFPRAAGVLSAIVVATVAAMYLLFTKANLWLPLGVPVLGFVALQLSNGGHRLLREQQAKRKIRNAFSSYLAPAVLEQVMKNPDEIKRGGVRKRVTILFSDIRGFTTWSESAEEKVFISQLNEYFTDMVACVNRHGGTLHKFIGDAIMAVWGDAISMGLENDARLALRAALDMRVALAQLNQKWQVENLSTHKIGIGLEHGEVLVGNVGAPQRMEFTVLGDAVNVASRIEGLTKYWHVDIAVGEKARALAGDRFLFRTLGHFRLVGKQAATAVCGLIRELQPGEPIPEIVRTYEDAFSAYVAGDFKRALVGFEQYLEMEPGDHCATHYSEICREQLVKPSTEPWDAVHVSRTK